ncbi:methyltransferase domain-containing protein [Ectothiorhodospiraceae bacterium BW-2]|nr:methyltransferase domain-containing protein [Ectothiorhodospiraceae bacterium BW-2]
MSAATGARSAGTPFLYDESGWPDGIYPPSPSELAPIAYLPLTALAQQQLAPLLSPDATVIDATVGNGHDTLFLAQQCGTQGQVVGFDVDNSAITALQQQLARQPLHRVTLFCHTHADMVAVLSAEMLGRVALIMFNLGYRPRSERRYTTEANTTLAALEQSLQLLKPEGYLSIMLYRGHREGELEARAVVNWLQCTASLTQRYSLKPEATRRPPPHWLLLQKQG